MTRTSPSVSLAYPTWLPFRESAFCRCPNPGQRFWQLEKRMTKHDSPQSLFLLLSSFENSGSDSRCSSDYLPSRLLNSCYCYCIYCEPFCHLMSFLFKVVKRGFTRHFAGPCPTVRFVSLHNTGHTHTGLLGEVKRELGSSLLTIHDS